MKRTDYMSIGAISLLWILYDVYIINSNLLYFVNISSIKDLLLITCLITLFAACANYMAQNNYKSIINVSIVVYSILIMIWWTNIYKFNYLFLFICYMILPVLIMWLIKVVSCRSNGSAYSLFKGLILSYVIGFIMLLISYCSIYIGILFF